MPDPLGPIKHVGLYSYISEEICGVLEEMGQVDLAEALAVSTLWTPHEAA